jgi:hypothetical protein
MDYTQGGPIWLKQLTSELDANNYELTETIVEETLDEGGPSGAVSGGASGGASGEQTGIERQKLQKDAKAMMGVKDLKALEALAAVAALELEESEKIEDDKITAQVIKENPAGGGGEGRGGRNAGVGDIYDSKKDPPLDEGRSSGGASGAASGGATANPIVDPIVDPPLAPPLAVVPKKSKPIDLSKQVKKKAMDISTPSTIDQIPKSRLSSDNKSQDQLRSDINYFLKNFPTPLKNIKTQAKRLNKMGLVQLQRLHKRIVNILQPNKMATSGEKVGVVIDAEEYIKRKVGEIMIDNAIKGYQIPNLQPVGDNIDNKSDGTKDIGSYEIKVGPEGGLNSQKEPVYRYIPTTNEEGVNEIEYNYQSKRKPKRMALPKTKMRNQVVTGKREVRTNPFLEKQGGHRLNVLL